MARVALYARFSSDNQKDSSVTVQFRNCETRATKEGWTITHRYQDKAISGSIHVRPDHQQMLKDAEARLFDILLVDDLNRLTRDEAELIHTRRQLVYWGVRFIGLSDGFDTAQKGHKMLSSFKGIMNEVFLDDLRDKTRRARLLRIEPKPVALIPTLLPNAIGRFKALITDLAM